MAGHFKADSNNRGGSPLGMNTPNPTIRGGAGSGADGQKAPTTSKGFQAALSASTSGSTLKGAIASKKSFSGRGFNKPNYFAQGKRRHGMHISNGAPAVIPAEQEGASV